MKKIIIYFDVILKENKKIQCENDYNLITTSYMLKEKNIWINLGKNYI